MLIDRIENHGMYLPLGKKYDVAFSFLLNTDLNKLALGKHTIDGESIFALVNEYETKIEDSVVYEAHKKYVDLHYMVSGTEQIGFSSYSSNSKEVRSYSADEDYALYEAEGSLVQVKPEMFAIFFPTDLHMPGISEENGAVGKVKKVVVKIRV